MNQETPSRFTRIVDYLWDHKARFLIGVAAFFFAIHGTYEAIDSIKNPETMPAAVVDSRVFGQIVDATSTTNSEVPATTPQAISKTPLQQTQPSKPASKPAYSHQSTETNQVTGLLPTRIVIEKFNVDSAVSNPATIDVDILDDILTRATVHYPGSGNMSSGNMLIMGHSSELPIIHNPMYKVFSQLKFLKNGDEIKVYAGTAVNTYRVTNVSMLSINDDQAFVPFASDNQMLTLVTCNVRGSKDQRYIVTADLISRN